MHDTVSHTKKILTPENEAERIVLTQGFSGSYADLSKLREATPDKNANVVRASFLVELLKEKSKNGYKGNTGLLVSRARVRGTFDLRSAHTEIDIAFHDCVFENEIDLTDAEIVGLYLPGCSTPRLSLHRTKINGDLNLNEGFRVDFGIDAIGATISGRVDLSEADISNYGAVAFSGDGMRVGVDLDAKGTEFEGSIHLYGARIKRDLCLSGAKIDGFLFLSCAVIGGVLSITKLSGRVQRADLSDCRARILEDDHSTYKVFQDFVVDGLDYKRLVSSIPTQDRIANLLSTSNHRSLDATGSGPTYRNHCEWLRDIEDVDFAPEPFTQLARVLRRSGDRSGAAKTLYWREVRVRQVAYNRAQAGVDGTVRAAFFSIVADIRRVLNIFFRYLYGYGHRPEWSLFWIFWIILLTALLYGKVYAEGQMAPNSDVILNSKHWLDAIRIASEIGSNPLHVWSGYSGTEPMPSYIDYETFGAFYYAVDLFIPLDAIGQENSWSPSYDRGWWGTIGWWMRFPVQLAGWITTAIGAAALAGLIGKS